MEKMKTVIVTKDYDKGEEYAKANNLNPLETWIDKDDKKAKVMEAKIVYLDEV